MTLNEAITELVAEYGPNIVIQDGGADWDADNLRAECDGEDCWDTSYISSESAAIYRIAGDGYRESAPTYTITAQDATA